MCALRCESDHAVGIHSCNIRSQEPLQLGGTTVVDSGRRIRTGSGGSGSGVSSGSLRVGGVGDGRGSTRNRNMNWQCTGWPRFGSVRLRFGDRTVRAVPVFGSGSSSKEGVFVCFSTVSQRGRFPVPVRFLENGSGGSGSAFGSCENGPTVPVSGSGSVPAPP